MRSFRPQNIRRSLNCPHQLTNLLTAGGVTRAFKNYMCTHISNVFVDNGDISSSGITTKVGRKSTAEWEGGHKLCRVKSRCKRATE